MSVDIIWPGPLTSTDWLDRNRDETDVVVLDATFFLPHQCRDADYEFRATRIPGARRFDIDDIADHSNPLPHMLPKTADFAKAISRLGIDHQTRVVVYDNNSFMASARAWWMFRIFGHDRVTVLDGGLPRWQADGRLLESGPSLPVNPSAFSAIYRPGLVRNLPDMLQLLAEPDTQVVDARSPGRFTGIEPELRPGLRAGHIPGSFNVFFKDLIDAGSGRLRTVAELERAFRSGGVDPYQPVVATCGTGVTASVLVLALFCLGNDEAAVYDGSWTEWGARADTPVNATGR